ncbi:glycosyltransferase family 87 protein [Streptomyces flavofungini]|uniref:glycosyltransferase family 87 protein n=1 Tax=Streptomyces flavofungini TaxID=68200 RepID=UPI0025B1C616|nr:glycosyltransferase family 87 protein [Streptomyces flavofungini]WJV46770.1 glycosyltransferase family 87 protein [Streptomyces flavofungini]
MDSGKTDSGGSSGLAGWLVRPAGWQVWAVLGVVLGAAALRIAYRVPDGGMDNAIVVRAAEAWLDGRSPYADRHFLYLPGAVLAAVPQALFPGMARVLVPVGVVGALASGWFCALRIHGVARGSRFAALGLLGLVLGFAPFVHLVELGNWTVASALALPVALLCVCRGRWVVAGAVIGVAVAVKPLLLPVLLLFVFARRWRALCVAVAVPVVVSVLAALVLPDPGAFFTRTLPFLLRGDDRFVRLYEASPAAVLPRVGVPGVVASLVSGVGACAGVWCAWRRWVAGGPAAGRVVEVASALMLAAFLVSRPSYDHYLLVVLPLLLAGALRVSSVVRVPWFWVALVPQVPGFVWVGVEALPQRAFKDAFTLCVLAGVVFWRCAVAGRLRGAVPPSSVPAPSVGGAGGAGGGARSEVRGPGGAGVVARPGGSGVTPF